MVGKKFSIYKKLYFKYLLSILWTMIILFLSLAKMPKTPDLERTIPHLDKIVHFSMYFIYTFILLFESTNNKKKNTTLIVMLYAIFFGILMEIMQANIFTYRSGDMYDFVANTVGAVSSFVTYPFIIRIIKP